MLQTSVTNTCQNLLRQTSVTILYYRLLLPTSCYYRLLASSAINFRYSKTYNKFRKCETPLMEHVRANARPIPKTMNMARTEKVTWAYFLPHTDLSHFLFTKIVFIFV